jgi:spore coat polysaccharide biosynthesis protein SpsF (cytidylyltransferase family)
MDCEVFSRKALDIAHAETIEPADREHVTPFIYRRSDRFALRNVEYVSDQSDHRWTVDTVQDFDLVSRMLEHLYPRHPSFTLEDCLDLWRSIQTGPASTRTHNRRRLDNERGDSSRCLEQQRLFSEVKA